MKINSTFFKFLLLILALISLNSYAQAQQEVDQETVAQRCDAIMTEATKRSLNAEERRLLQECSASTLLKTNTMQEATGVIKPDAERNMRTIERMIDPGGLFRRF